MTTYITTDPRTCKVLAEFDEATDEQVETAIASASTAHSTWSAGKLDTRADLLARIAAGHRAAAQVLARTVTLEMGKPLVQALGEIELAASIYQYYSENAATLLADEEIEISGGGRALVRTSSTGPILGVMPWNFPIYQVARFVAPNLLVGNTVILKHAGSCPQVAIALAEVISGAGAPAGTYTNLLCTTSQVADLIADDRLRGVSLTGSERAGRIVGAQAGKYLKKCVLELGGSDPFIVLPDADLDAALDAAESGRFANAGQSCTSMKRMIIHTDVWDEFLTRFVQRAEAWTTGDPLDETTKLGPMASIQGRDQVSDQVADAVSKGATVHLGGTVPDGPGSYYPATVISGVTQDMRAYREELFGPVAVLYRVESAREAVDLANDSPFGLGSAVFSQDASQAARIADQLEVGMVGLNTLVRSLPNLPFGGVKASGIGRELGRQGLDEFANKKVYRLA